MTNLQLILISALQGLTEFLPVSSSGHLILFSKFTTFPDQGAEMDVSVHVGSIIAVIIYFWREIWEMLKGLWQTKFLPLFSNQGAKLAWLIIIATIPAVVAGLALKTYGLENLRSAKLIGWTISGYAILLYLADKFGKTIRTTKELTIKDAILIGCAQCLALIPGTSRSGITITTARLLGIQRREAAKFSMLLSIPTIAGAGLLVALSLWQSGEWGNISDACHGIAYSFVASLGAIFIMMTWLKKWTFTPFVIYRLILGGYLLLNAYGYLN
ncbi:MAG: undecaprenyl-diphosphate phosphatase [Alphaproteobacteria bacterium]|nr:undecaprenyl-diphosphate phosphatase [Alphaproteobacteria bacterium]